jgi:acetyltransferase-like isoleucine patch superfamily enzyme
MRSGELMAHLWRPLARQFTYARRADARASRFATWKLALRYDCWVSPEALVYYPTKIELARGVQIHPGAMLNYRSNYGTHSVNIRIGEGTKVMPGARLVPQQGRIAIGRNCTIQYGCLLYGVGQLEIGDDVRMAAYTVVTPMNHVFSDPDLLIRLQGETARGVRIGSDVWIGAGVKIVDGVTIGDGCVVGAGSVVTKDLAPFSVAVGVPARVVRQRR